VTLIHPTAIVDPHAELGADVEVGPYSVIDGSVRIGARTVIGAHVRLTGFTTLGEDCRIHTGAALGDAPQDTKFHGEESYVRVGDRTIIREYVTIHVAVGEGNATTVGNDCMFMACSHIGHNCTVGTNVCAANYVGLSGGCRIDDRAVLGGMAGFHQFVHVGRMAMVGGCSKVNADVPPFTIVDGNPSKSYGLNVVGLRRGGVSTEAMTVLKKVYRLLLSGNRNLQEALMEARALPQSAEVTELIDFINRSGRQGRHLDPRFSRAEA
jgi:UDP-N-acetylglucosamine acyltransferase